MCHRMSKRRRGTVAPELAALGRIANTDSRSDEDADEFWGVSDKRTVPPGGQGHALMSDNVPCTRQA